MSFVILLPEPKRGLTRDVHRQIHGPGPVVLARGPAPTLVAPATEQQVGIFVRRALPGGA